VLALGGAGDVARRGGRGLAGVLQERDGVGGAVGDGDAVLDGARSGGGGVGCVGGRAGDLREDRVDARGGLT
jgi:hypothetical protein